MRKYLYGFKMYFLHSFNYRFDTVTGLIFGNTGLFIEMIFWSLIYTGDFEKTLNGYTLSSMVTYYLINRLFRHFILGSYGSDYVGMIKGGSLGQVLLKPYSINIYMYFKNLSGSFTSMLPQTLFVLAAMPFIAKYLTWNINLINLIFLILFLIISTLTSQLLTSILGYMAFWLENAAAVMWSLAVLLNLFSGMFIPLDFFPEWSIFVLERTPFASWGYLPAKIYLGLFDSNTLIKLLIAHSLWVVILLALNKIIFKIGIKRYSSVGG
ncbi:MAG: ABC-2 family transporter protein [Oscillospiraceae bacterium]|nr:ABC-2 family transporter protein [Oscillospiraceae bacterium]